MDSDAAPPVMPTATPRRTVAVLPVKRFSQAKQRLGDAVPDGRPELAAMMVQDVLVALWATPSVDDVVVVTNEDRAIAAAESVGATVIADERETGQSPAARAGVRHATQAGAERVLLVPGDCPALDPAELEALLRATAAERVVIVPDRHGSGTNALVLTPPGVIDPSFGPDSRARHESLAAAAGVRPALAHPASLLLDVDTGADLGALRERLAGEDTLAPRTRAWLRRHADDSPTLAGR
jgi:2-phospho-L-lactate guanylyltransferase